MPFYYRVSRVIVRAFYFLFFRWEVYGAERVPKNEPVLYCSNHISNLDPITVGAASERKVHYMAKQELFKNPILAYIITLYGAFPVKRGAASKEPLMKAVELLRDNKTVLIFPEGTRSKTGKLGKPYPGAVLVAKQSAAKVVPVAIIGQYRLFGKIKVIFGEPMEIAGWDGEQRREAMQKAAENVMDAIRRLIENST